MTTQKNIIVGLALCAILFLGMAAPLKAAEVQKSKEAETVKATSTVTAKEIEGTVTWIGKNKIAITYSSDESSGMEYEILLPFDKNGPKVGHKKNLGEINLGDTVRVQYNEEAIEYENGKQEGKLSAQVIDFIKPGMKKPGISKPSEKSDDSSLSLKGLKGG